MSRVVSADQLDGAESVKRVYEPPAVPPKPREEPLLGDKFVQALSQAILMGFRNAPAPVVNVEAPKAPDVKVSSPSVYVTAPEVKVPASTVNVPEGRAPVVNIEPPDVHLTINRPKKWHFTVNRNEYGQMTSIDAEAR